MRIGQEIESIRIKRGLAIIDMCDTLATDEAGYHRIIIGRDRPTIYQLIMVINDTHHPLHTI